MLNNAVLDKEIDLIQSCINRMSQNSFMVKGWMISLVAVIIALLPETLNVDIRVLCIVAFAVTICFWNLDAFFLKTEKLYKWKYYWVIKNRLETLDFAYDLNPHNKNMWIGGISEPCLLTVMFSKTSWPLYSLFLGTELFVFMNASFGWL